MSVSLYDKALVDKIKRWVKDDSLTITSPEETRRLFQYKADISEDRPISLPLIAIRRSREVEIGRATKNPMTYDGLTVEAQRTLDTNKSNILNAIPISIRYQIDIYTRYFEENDAYVRNFVFNLINFPKLVVEIPYNNSHKEHVAYIKLSSTIQDNSDIPERLVAGQFTRQTLTLEVDDAYIWDYRPVNNYEIEIPSISIE